eukprot:g6229.t1
MISAHPRPRPRAMSTEAELVALKKVELIRECKARGLSTQGLKSDLVARILTFQDAEQHDDGDGDGDDDSHDHYGHHDGVSAFLAAAASTLSSSSSFSSSSSPSPSRGERNTPQASLRAGAQWKRAFHKVTAAHRVAMHADWTTAGTVARAFVFEISMCILYTMLLEALADLFADGSLVISFRSSVVLTVSVLLIIDALFYLGLHAWVDGLLRGAEGTKVLGMVMYGHLTTCNLVVYDGYLDVVRGLPLPPLATSAVVYGFYGWYAHKALQSGSSPRFFYKNGHYWMSTTAFYYHIWWLITIFMNFLSLRKRAPSLVPASIRFLMMDVGWAKYLVTVLFVFILLAFYLMKDLRYRDARKVANYKSPTPGWLEKMILLSIPLTVYALTNNMTKDFDQRHCPLTHALDESAAFEVDPAFKALTVKAEEATQRDVVAASFMGSDPAHQVDFAEPFGCVKATFKVSSVLSPQMQRGIFATPGKAFPAWIRLSQGGGSDSDYMHSRSSTVYGSGGSSGGGGGGGGSGSGFGSGRLPPIKGLALKLMEVPGEKLLKKDEGGEAKTQDFI